MADSSRTRENVAVDGSGPSDSGSAAFLIRPAAVALHARDLRERWAAQAGEMLSGSLRAERIAFLRVDARGEHEREVVLLNRSSRARAVSAALADYQECFGGGTPFLPLRHADTVDRIEHGWPPMSDAEDVRRTFAALCGRWGIVDVLTLYLADAGRIVGHFNALRMIGQRPFGAADLRVARAAHGLLETSYTAVLYAALTLDTTDDDAILAEAGLSAREIEVARFLAQGATNKQIAAALSRSPSTVNTHVTRILAKLGLGNRAQVAGMLSAPNGR